jgi:beta-mannanase
MKKILFFLSCILGFGSFSFAYYFGLKSADDSVANIQALESQLGVRLSLVSFIFDPWEQYNVPAMMDSIAQNLGTNRVYHITISPNMYSAQQVANGAFDTQYLQFFGKVKEHNLRVIFRTMHEMNGGRYPRGSNPDTFKKAWIHVWELSRSVGLDQHNILFDFSVNHRDMPTKEQPSQTATLYQCKPEKTGSGSTVREAQWKDCPKFEDYYPDEKYVDIVGFSFYNW